MAHQYACFKVFGPTALIFYLMRAPSYRIRGRGPHISYSFMCARTARDYYVVPHYYARSACSRAPSRGHGPLLLSLLGLRPPVQNNSPLYISVLPPLGLKQSGASRTRRCVNTSCVIWPQVLGPQAQHQVVLIIQHYL